MKRSVVLRTVLTSRESFCAVCTNHRPSILSRAHASLPQVPRRARSAMPCVEPAECVTVNGNMYRPVREGLASLLAPYSDQNSPALSEQKKPKNNNEGHQAVFYNPIHQFNRDLSVLAILIYGEGALARKEQRYFEKNETRVNQRVGAKKRKVAVN